MNRREFLLAAGAGLGLAAISLPPQMVVRMSGNVLPAPHTPDPGAWSNNRITLAWLGHASPPSAHLPCAASGARRRPHAGLVHRLDRMSTSWAELRGFAQATYQRIQEIVKTAGWFRQSPNLESDRTANVVGTGFPR